MDTLSDTQTLLQLALVVVLALGCQLVAPRIRVPAILLLLLAGFTAGATGLLDTDALFGDLVSPIVSLATGIILLEGGLRLTLRGLDPGHRPVVRRSLTVGLVVTFVLASLAAWSVVGLPADIAVLVGAIVVVSGPTVVGPLLDFIRPSRGVDTVLRWEGTLIDPIGALLGVVTFQVVLNESFGSGQAVVDYVVAIGVGAGLGVAGALVLMGAIRVLRLDLGEARSAAILVAIGVVALADAISDDSGLLSTLLMGMILANLYLGPRRRERSGGAGIEYAKSVREFGTSIEGVASFLIGVLFIMLSSRVSVDDLREIGPVALAFLAVLVVVVRPVSVALWTAGSSLSARERCFVAWMAPRGIIAAATASSFALSLEAAGVAGAEKIVPLTFVVILGTAAVYGLTGRPAAAALGVAGAGVPAVLVVGSDAVALGMARAVCDAGVPAVLAPLGRRPAAAADPRVRVHDGDVLDDLTGTEPSPLDDVGTVVLATGSDELNSILATDLGNLGSRAQIVQVAPAGPDGSDGGSLFERAPVLSGPRATHEALAARLAAGAAFTVRPAGDDPRGALFVVTPGRALLVVRAGEEVRPRAGQLVVALPEPPPGG